MHSDPPPQGLRQEPLRESSGRVLVARPARTRALPTRWLLAGFCWLLAGLTVTCFGPPVRAAAPEASDEQANDARVESIVSLLELVIATEGDSARQCLDLLAGKIHSGEMSPRQWRELKPRLEPLLAPILAREPDQPLYFESAVLAVGWGHEPSRRYVRKVLADVAEPQSRRLRALAALVSSDDPQLGTAVAEVFSQSQRSPVSFRGAVLDALGKRESPDVADLVLKHYAQLETELQPKAIELLTQRTAWSLRLLEAIGQGRVPPAALHRNQVARLLASRDPELARLVREKWGTVRTERNPQREAVLEQMRSRLLEARGDAFKGKQVFQRVCGQCHRIHGEGQMVGPDITANGRGSFEQLLSNVFDPSLVIGSSYQARTVVTADGRVLTGLVAEDSPQRMVLNLQGGKQEVIPRDQIDEVSVSRLSLMPEGLEVQLPPQDLADLFAFLVLEGAPTAAEARPIPGAPANLLEARPATP